MNWQAERVVVCWALNTENPGTTVNSQAMPVTSAKNHSNPAGTFADARGVEQPKRNGTVGKSRHDRDRRLAQYGPCLDNFPYATSW